MNACPPIPACVFINTKSNAHLSLKTFKEIVVKVLGAIKNSAFSTYEIHVIKMSKKKFECVLPQSHAETNLPLTGHVSKEVNTRSTLDGLKVQTGYYKFTVLKCQKISLQMLSLLLA